MASATDVKTYKFNHSMIRVKDPKESLKFYQDTLGMKLIKKLDFPDAKFTLYFMAYDSPSAKSAGNSTFDREGVIEFTHNWGTENDPSYTVNSGNKEPHRGFGHTCIAVDHLQAACDRIEKAGYKFQKKISDGRMRNIAFALDPDGYWVELVSWNKVEEDTATTTDVSTYRMNHTMIRVKDAQKSIKFYEEVMGMKVLRELPLQDAGCTLYFLGFPEQGPWSYDREGLLELTYNHGTEKDENFSYHSGNVEPKGFGHICITVDNVEAACKRFEEVGVNWKKRLAEGMIKNVAFILDPDGYWVEIVQNERYSGKENF